MQPQTPNIPKAPEATPDLPAPSLDRLNLPPSPEAGLTTGAERHEQVAELSAAQADAASSAVPLTQMAQPSIVGDTTVSTGAPLTASNDDLIEKEWVDRAKKVVINTPNDPHARGQQKGALQKDYLQKRFGKELGRAA